ncbi:hypothetical protein BH10ACT11_BH10ACT11_03230 [soil metagenome]
MESLDTYLIQSAGISPDGGYAMDVDALAMDRFNRRPEENPKRGLMSDLKQQIEMHEYKIDSGRIAEEMIKRMRLTQSARRALVNDGAGSRGRPATA